MKKPMKRIILFVGLLLIVFLAVYAYRIYDSLNGLSKGKTVAVEGITDWNGKDRVNVLLLGGDSRDSGKDQNPRSDTIMIASVDPAEKSIVLFSVLRDTYVSIPDHGKGKINAALALGGPSLAIQTVSNLLDIPIHYYVYTDFQGFMSLIDAIGGIEIDVEKNMDYEDAADGHKFDIHLKKGLQDMDGKTALQYVRFRHDATSDFTRTERQRKLIAAVTEKLQNASSLVKLPGIIKSVSPYVDTNMKPTDMLKLGRLGLSAKGNGIDSVQLPPTNLIQNIRTKSGAALSADPAALQGFVSSTLEQANEQASGKGEKDGK
ncbi:LCP family protein [Gorillibacterium timonense]|uniref:LCP family protein n=1 Tax=Gorillibacterium timonense TaxID=1689269 RepID=UPI00071D481E|nr:LCP family protein [Gorillibacterium timonense]